MPVYRYKAVAENGLIVSNVIEESSKYMAIKRLKRNNLTPINVHKSLQRKKYAKPRKNGRTISKSITKKYGYNKPISK